MNSYHCHFTVSKWDWWAQKYGNRLIFYSIQFIITIRFLFCFVFVFPYQVWYKGFFVPIDGGVSTDCPTECPPIQTSTKAPAPPVPPATTAQSWGDAPAKFAVQLTPPKIGHHQNSDVEIFDGSDKITTAKPKLESLDGEKQQQSNVNIEIHNVFSFGTGNNSLLPQQQQHSPLSGQTDDKINLPNNPQIIYA